MIANIRFKDLISVLGIFILSFSYMVFRVNDLTPLSDELYYFTESLKAGERRWFFASFVQIFDAFEKSLIIVFIINSLLLIPIYYFLVRLNEGNSIITFFQMFYLTTLASYLLRDIFVFLLLLWALRLILDYSKSKHRHLSFFMLGAIVFILSISKLQYVFYLFVAILVAFMSERAPKKLAIICISIACLFFFTSYWVSLLNVTSIYSISMMEFVNLRSERYEYELSLGSFVIVVLKHIFAPMPFSLLDRFLYPDISHKMINVDDVYRFLYRSSVYFCFFYIIFNIRLASKYIKNNRFFIFLISTISVLNIVTYAIFTGGGGHERSKLVSVLIIFTITSGTMALKKNMFRSKVYKT